MNTKFSVELPFFPGFYESWAYDSDNDYYETKEYVVYHNENNEKQITDDDVEFDFEKYKKDVVHAFIEAWKNLKPSFVEDIDTDNAEIDSPRYYNFRTDELYTQVTLSENWFEIMKQFINDNQDWFAERIHKDWTSYDGFWSHMDNYVEGWIKNLEAEDTRYIGCMIGYIAIFDNPDIKGELMMETMDDIWMQAYMSVKTDE